VKVLFDTDVVLDLLLDRRPHALPAAKLLSKVENGEIAGYLCATAVTTIHYLAAKVVGAKRARIEVQKLLSLFEIAPVNRAILEAALEGGFSDFEDAVVHEAARHVEVQGIVTRNLRDFKTSAVPVYAPGDLLAVLEAGGAGDR
jgi:predicted nucleic acid-binding protein